MNDNCYIIGKALCCNLGNKKEEITTNLLNLDQHNYQDFLDKNFTEKPFYKLQNFELSESKRFFEVLKHILDEVIQDAQLSQIEQEDLHIFIGSTSMGISINEETNKEFKKNSNKDELSHIGYGYIGTFVEKYLNSKHKATIFSTACTSSTNALAHASKLINSKKIKRAVVIGIELFNESTFNGFSSLMLLSKSCKYKPFDENSDGIILGEGCSAIILDSTTKNDLDFKYISSSNICDNYSETTSNPSGEPIFRCMHKSMQRANLNLEDIDLLKAHATGSENSNSAEANAINLLFEEYNSSTKVSALKPYIGHTLGACGTNEIILTIYCIEKGIFPATLGFEKSNSKILFQPLTSHTKNNSKATILFNFVAFGGNNSSIILSNKS